MARRAICLVAAILAVVVFSRAAAAQPDLHPGSRGPLVAQWQRVLNRWLTVSPTYTRAERTRERIGGELDVDGVFGPRTELATRAFQRDGHLAPTGVVGLREWLSWIGANVTCCGAGYATLRRGSENAYVGWWQYALDRWLHAHRLRGLTVDMIFGPATERATGTLQRAVGLHPTGITDTVTWRALGRTSTGTSCCR